MSKEEHIEKDLKQAIQLHEQQELKAQLQQLEQKGRSRSLAFKWLSAVAAVILLMVVAGIVLLQKPADGPALYASHFEPYPNALEPVTRGIEPADFRMQAFEAYEAGEYAKATAAFQQMLSLEEEPNIRFYLAMSLQNNSQYGQALAKLKLLQGSGSRFEAQALWYQALLEIRAEQREEAAQTLELLLQAVPAYKAPEARELLEKL